MVTGIRFDTEILILNTDIISSSSVAALVSGYCFVIVVAVIVLGRVKSIEMQAI